MINIKVLLVSPKSRTIVNFRGDLIKEMISKEHDVVTIGPETEYQRQIEELGAKFILLNMKKNSIGILHDLRYIINLMKIIRKEKPDVIFNYTVKPVIYGSIAAKLSRVKKIYPMITGLGYVFTSKSIKTKIIKFVVSILYRISFLCANKVFFQNSDDLNEFVNKRYLPKSKCVLVNGSGVNMIKFSRQPLPKEMSFLMIARVMRNKGVMEYLEAARIIKRKYHDVKFTLLGAIEKIQDSLTYEEIRSYIEDGSIEYFGETTDVRPYFSNCSVYVLPSYREGTPRTVLEAMAIGRPIITSDAPGCRETVFDEINGFLIPIKDVNALTEKMIWMIEHREEMKNMAQESFRICSKKYDVEIVNKVMLKTMGLWN